MSKAFGTTVSIIALSLAFTALGTLAASAASEGYWPRNSSGYTFPAPRFTAPAYNNSEQSPFPFQNGGGG
jgi:hypothetical protein